MTVGCRNRSAQLRLALEGVMRVNEYFEPPIVYLGQFRAYNFEVALKLSNVGANGAFRMTGSCFTPIQITLVAGVTFNAIKHLFVIGHHAGVPHVGNGAQDHSSDHILSLALRKAVSLSHLLAVFAGWHDACP